MGYDLTSAERAAIRGHLRRDPVLRPLVDGYAFPDERIRPSRVYPTLLRAIVGQQVSIHAAATIWRRFLALFGLEPAAAGPATDSHAVAASPPPAVLAKATGEALRGAGLSRAKADYVRAVADYFLDGGDRETAIERMSDEEAIAELTGIRGVGRWTAEMTLLFSLGRRDLLPLDDLAISQTIAELYDLAETGRALKAKQRELAEAWRPYRSVACLYLYTHRRANRSAPPALP